MRKQSIMIRYALIPILSILSLSLWAQTGTRNYVQTTTYTTSGGGSPVKDITYTDGFDRPLQEIAVGASPVSGKDIVQVYQYGLFGRTEKSYLPFAKSNSGAFITNAYSSSNWSIYGTTDQSYAFTKTEYDGSPFDRVLKQTGAGAAWHSNNKGITSSYALNTTNEVVLWRVNGDNITNAGYYSAGSLTKTTVTDEDGISMTEYKDNQDRVLLSVSGTAKTYYVYDEYSNLRYVLTPEAVSQGINTTTTAKYCYSYKYDNRQRLIEKSLPGVDVQKFVYDAKDRLVLSQDGNQRSANKWSYSLYDSKNRVIETGETTDAINKSTVNTSQNFEPSNKTILQYIYYDNYDCSEKHPFNTTENISGETNYAHVSGLQTGAKTKVLGTDKWLITTTYYDSRVRPIQVIADIYDETTTGLKSYINTKYDFVGNVLQTREKHETGSGADVSVITNTYDARGRQLTQNTTLNGTATASISFVYDELGRLASKKYGNNTVTETFAYNVRGWITDKSSSKFSMKLRYNDAQRGTTARYNGNISEWEWKNNSAAEQAYAFTYDNLNRLTDSKQYTKNGSSWSLSNSFNENGITYDLNGNIKTLQRNANGSLTNNLSYAYNGNQLSTITGATGNYIYDNNGNMTKDARKSLNLSYNVLNLLSEVSEGSTVKANYFYAADGTKLGVKDASNNGYYYRGSLVYKRQGSSNTLESVGFGDGVIKKTNTSYVPNYFITDHLGSVRVIVDVNGIVLEQNDYYPFGGRHANSNYAKNDNRYKYNGKELQTTGDINYLDYGARMYDEYLGRWFGVDPAEQFVSPYNFCGNNPIIFVDPNGCYIPTRYEDEEGNLLLDTNDGSNAIVTVPKYKEQDFLWNILVSYKANTNILNSKGWNYYWKEELTGIKWNDDIENWIDRLGPDANVIRLKIEMLSGTTYSVDRLAYMMEYGDPMAKIGAYTQATGYLMKMIGGKMASIGTILTKVGATIGTTGTILSLSNSVHNRRYNAAFYEAGTNIFFGAAGKFLGAASKIAGGSDYTEYFLKTLNTVTGSIVGEGANSIKK